MTTAELAALHARCFTSPRPWNEAEFTDILGVTGSFLTFQPDGFLLGRVIADEAELLTIAVDPNSRRRGTGRRLIADFVTEAHDRGATTAFLEVAADNLPALALYRATGWQDAGSRRNYYGPDQDAILMHLPLTEGEQSG